MIKTLTGLQFGEGRLFPHRLENVNKFPQTSFLGH